ncbi:RNA polymerase sigma factor [Pedosphaera parvula]|uniref:RNA polymerase, sigma-24 subunit, ECF subfamily n=1 Tax=Pedosphaera parvula (strain Ellin514) TaxID=320771 RepID=B9XHW6_PEDPL|nr:sigma-70 family RNA polymerase sigma factor [Pedosphaera parvula]EEF60459.1 RNA polymerase, sigma-24 subunit, ECF subfamily [Pedosphaera parvula Ellin514]
MTDDAQLLRRFTSEGSEDAFNSLVTRHIDLVYSAALRMANGDSHLAQDVTQTVFTDLARKASSLSPNVILPGWLYRHACFTASKSIRTERRRQAREQTAMQLNSLSNEPDVSWDQIAPLLEPAMAELAETDRDALVLRYFNRQDLRTVGNALNLSEDAAQKRVSRALDKLRTLLHQRGATLTVTALAGLLTAEAVSAAPAGIIATISGTAVAATVATGGFTWALVTKLLLISALIAAIAVPLAIQHQTGVKLLEENRSLRRQMDEASRLEAENKRFSNLLASRNEAQSLARTQLNELLRLRSEVSRLRQQTTLVKNQPSKSSPISLKFENLDLSHLLELYAQTAHRSILRPTALPQTSFTLNTSATNDAEAALLLEKALAEKGFTTVLDGDKFAMIVPAYQASIAVPHSAEIKTSPPRWPGLEERGQVPTGEVNFPAAFVETVTKIYAELIHRKLISHDRLPPGLLITFRNQTPLTKSELIYALDTLLAWQNIKVIPVGDDSVQAVVSTAQ